MSSAWFSASLTISVNPNNVLVFTGSLFDTAFPHDQGFLETIAIDGTDLVSDEAMLGDIQIDGAYVRDICKEPRHVPFVKAIIELCRDLDIRTIAEMIEDEETVKLLARLGVDYGQGYLFGKPKIGLPAK